MPRCAALRWLAIAVIRSRRWDDQPVPAEEVTRGDVTAALLAPVHPDDQVAVRAALVARATDDHTIGLMINGNMTIAKILNPDTTYDPIKDLTPVSLIAVAPLVLSVPATVAESGAALAPFFGNIHCWRSAGPHRHHGIVKVHHSS